MLTNHFGGNMRMSMRVRVLAVTGCLVLMLGGCASDAPKGPPREQISYLDTSAFDRNLSNSLGADLPEVVIPVQDKMTPVAIPERLNKWLSAVDANGGQIQVKEMPAVDANGKARGFPIALIGVAIEVVRHLYGKAEEKQYKPAARYDAELQVRTGANGERIIEKVVMRRRDTQ